MHKKHESMNSETETFLKELKELCKKHNVFLDKADGYDGKDNHCGTTYTFMGAHDKKAGVYKIWLELGDIDL